MVAETASLDVLTGVLHTSARIFSVYMTLWMSSSERLASEV